MSDGEARSTVPTVTLTIPVEVAHFHEAYLSLLRWYARDIANPLATPQAGNYSHAQLLFLAEIGHALHNILSPRGKGVAFYNDAAKRINEYWIPRRHHLEGTKGHAFIRLLPLPMPFGYQEPEPVEGIAPIQPRTISIPKFIPLPDGLAAYARDVQLLLGRGNPACFYESRDFLTLCRISSQLEIATARLHEPQGVEHYDRCARELNASIAQAYWCLIEDAPFLRSLLPAPVVEAGVLVQVEPPARERPGYWERIFCRQRRT